MKGKVFLGFAVFGLLISMALFIGMTASKELNAQSRRSPSVSQVPIGNLLGRDGRNYSNYIAIEGQYVANLTHTWYKIYNTSLSSTITLGPIYVMQKEGINNYTQYDGLKGTTIAPFGSSTLQIIDTGAEGETLLVVITWNGGENFLKVAGNIKTELDHKLSSRTIYPF